ncbi:Uncharacterised protein [Mycobacteroides abscessus]|nr:Uncharacterised protein [Mycobacteroides abscessus]
MIFSPGTWPSRTRKPAAESDARPAPTRCTDPSRSVRSGLRGRANAS